MWKLLALFFFVCSAVSSDVNPLSDEFIAEINRKAKTWTAGRNFDPSTPESQLRSLLGVLPDPDNYRLPPKSIGPSNDLPEEFDSRTEWPECPSIQEIRDQANCGSCWAFAAVGAMSDRECIHTNGECLFRYSAQDLLSCCKNCGDGCHGGYPSKAWRYWASDGLVSGGQYHSNEGCKPYEIKPCRHGRTLKPCGSIVKTPKCKETCQDVYNVSYARDKHFGKRAYSLLGDSEAIRQEIYKNGPFAAEFDVYEDFRHYKSGVYHHVHGKYLAGHAVRIIGWGVENKSRYWLIANSWNVGWGDKGYFKILRGSNECGIESHISAGIPASAK